MVVIWIMNPQRRLSDKIIIAHAKACDDGRMDVAETLLQALELPAHRRLGEIQPLRRTGDAAGFDHKLEGPQGFDIETHDPIMT